MSEIETGFKLAYDALLEEMPDPPSFDDIATTMVAPTRLRRAPVWVAAVTAAVAVVLLVGGIAVLFPGAESEVKPVGVATTIEETPEKDEPTPLFPEVEIARGVYAGSESIWIMSAYLSTDGLLCIRLDSMGCISSPDTSESDVIESAVMSTYGGGRWCFFGTVGAGAEGVEFDLGSGEVVETPVYTHPSFETGFYAYCGLGDQPVMRMKVLRTVIDLNTVPSPVEILSDGVVTDDEFEMAGLAVIQCLADVGVEASFNHSDGSFDAVTGDDSTFDGCYQKHMGDQVQMLWSDQRL
jgi:hypothetical protein